MTERITLDLSFDYNNLKYDASMHFYDSTIPSVEVTYPVLGTDGLISDSKRMTLLSGITSDPLNVVHNEIEYSIINNKGVIMAAGHMAKTGEFQSRCYGRAEHSFGLTNQGSFGFDRSTQSGTLWSTNPWCFFRPEFNLASSDISNFAALSGNVNTQIVDTNCPLSQEKDAYKDVPLQFTRGEACLYAEVTAISNNRVTWANNQLVTQPNAVDFTDSIVESISGSLSGQQFRVLSYNNSSNYLWLDKSGTLTDNLIRVSPRVTITGYSGWFSSSLTENKFFIDQSIPAGIGDVTGELDNAGDVGDSSYLLGGGISLETTTLQVPRDPYKREPQFGDIIEYTNNSSTLSTGMIVEVSGTVNTQSIKCIPQQDPHPTTTFFRLKRTSMFDVELYPQFSENYTISSNGTTTYPWYGNTSVKAPDVDLQVAAGDYDSVFGTVTEKSHFHIGPVHLTNGQTLTGDNIYISGSLFNNNPTSVTALTSWMRFTSADTNIANIHSGIYSKFGALVGTYNQAFTTPDMLTLEAKASIGSAYVNKVINFAVQPPV